MLRFWREGNCCYDLFGFFFFLTENSKYFISIPSEDKVLDFVHYIQVAAQGWGQWPVAAEPTGGDPTRTEAQLESCRFPPTGGSKP